MNAMPSLVSQDDSAFLPLTEFAHEPVTWLWPGRIALGKLAILDGDPGLGKSLVSLDLCACVTSGHAFPDGAPGCPPGNVILLNAEDAVEDTIKPRLMSLGADVQRVLVPQRAKRGTGAALRLPGQVERLRDGVKTTQARLVVIDPITAFLERSVWAGTDAAARLALSPLEEIAEQHRCAMLLIRHLNKSGGGRALYRGLGSIGFVGVCRSAWLIGRDPEEPSRCILAQVKNNLAPAQPSLAYTLVPQEKGPPLVSWLGTTALSADALVRSPDADHRGRPREQACAALAEFLQEEAHTSQEIWDWAQDEEITERTLRRAKTKLKIRCRRVWADGRRLSYWLLPDQELPEQVQPKANENDSVEPWLKSLNERFPPATPIDDL